MAATQYNLAVMLGNGQGVARDMVEAYKWLSIAAAEGFQEAKWNRYRAGKRMSVAELAEAERRAEAWRQSHSLNGSN